MTWPHSRPYVQTRLWADRAKTEYLHVYVFRDREAMYRFWRRRPGHCLGEPEDFTAFCDTWTLLSIGRPKRRARSFGQTLFYRDTVGAGVVAHEMVHAALGYVFPDPNVRGEKKWPRKMTAEEFYHSERHEEVALVTGDLVRQFWMWWLRKGLG